MVEMKNRYELQGPVIAKREGKSAKNNPWWMVSVAVVGTTITVGVTEAEYNSVTVGEDVHVDAFIVDQGGKLRIQYTPGGFRVVGNGKAK